MNEAIRVVVIDGHTLTRIGLAGLTALHPDLEIAGETDRAGSAPALVTATRPDVVTIDVALPDGDGLRLARELRDRHPELGIVILTSDGGDDVLFRALDTGVSAFVEKTAPASEVIAAIRHAAVAARSFTATGLAGAMARRAVGGSIPMTAPGLSLSPREAEVLALLSQGLSVPAIAQATYLSTSTAKTYVARLYDKLGASNRAQALMTALRHGLVDTELQPTG